MEIILNVLDWIVDRSVFVCPSRRYLRANDIETGDSVGDVVCSVVQYDKDFINTTRIKLFHHFETHDLELFKEFSLG